MILDVMLNSPLFHKQIQGNNIIICLPKGNLVVNQMSLRASFPFYKLSLKKKSTVSGCTSKNQNHMYCD